MLICIPVGGLRSARAADVGVAPKGSCKDEPIIQGYEPTTLGYARQGDDEPFVDFTLSVKAPLFRSLLCRHLNGAGHLYLAFTGRFAFYLGTRHSDPVISREYNPKLLWRFVDTRAVTKSTATYDNRTIDAYARYLDIAYAHSSNGQTIDTLAEYEIQSNDLGSARDAMDYISRGWDYLEVDGKATIRSRALGSGDLSLYPDLKFFLRHGLLQGVPEEYHSWETDPTLLPRHAFDGVSMAFEYRPFAERRSAQCTAMCSMRFELAYTTGYEPFARYNTVRGEMGMALLGLPVAVWIQDGYMNSLARYFRKTNSAGIELRFIQF